MHTNTQACTHCAQGWWPSVSSQPSCLFHLNAGMWLLLLLLLCNCSQTLEPPSCHRQWESERGDERREIELWGKGIKKKRKRKAAGHLAHVESTSPNNGAQAERWKVRLTFTTLEWQNTLTPKWVTSESSGVMWWWGKVALRVTIRITFKKREKKAGKIVEACVLGISWFPISSWIFLLFPLTFILLIFHYPASLVLATNEYANSFIFLITLTAHDKTDQKNKEILLIELRSFGISQCNV